MMFISEITPTKYAVMSGGEIIFTGSYYECSLFISQANGEI
jgi:hypothetical protein